MISRLDLLGLIIAGSFFFGFLVGVRILETITARLGSITFIKTVHTIVFVPLSGLLFVFAYEVAVNRVTYLTWIAVAVFLAEGIVLMTNNGRCPLTKYAERLGSKHGQITDFFFPKWFADRVFLVYGGLFAASFVLLVIRLVV